MVDRLSDVCDQANRESVYLEFLQEGDQVVAKNEEESNLLEEMQKEFESFAYKIDSIVLNTQKVMKLEARTNIETSQTQQQNILKDLETLMDDTMIIAKSVKDMLTKTKDTNEKFEKTHPHSTISQWRQNKLHTTTLRFQKAITAFNTASDSFKLNLRNKIARQARLVNREITDEQIDEIVNSSDPTKFMQQALLIPDAMIDRIAEIEERHEGILSIEKGVKELTELWNQLSFLIDEQQEQLDNIEANVDQTRKYVTQGNKELQKASEYQLSARKKTMCLIALLFVVVLAIAGPIAFGL